MLPPSQELWVGNPAGFSFLGKLEAELSLRDCSSSGYRTRSMEHNCTCSVTVPVKYSRTKRTWPQCSLQECFLSWDQMSFLGENDLTTAPGTLRLLTVFLHKALEEATEGSPGSASAAG